MTAAVLTASSVRPEPTLGVAAGRVLLLAGTVFGLANLFQYGVRSGALGLHEAALGLSWPAAVAVFLVSLAALRRAGGQAGRRAAAWSRAAILALLVLAGGLAVLAVARQDASVLNGMTVASLGLYALAWTIAFFRTGRFNPALIAAIAGLGAFGVAVRLGTPEASLIQAATLSLVAVLPGLWLALGRRL